jgi:transposase
MSKKVIFKTYDQDQSSPLPPSYDDLVPVNHPVRIVNTIIDHVDIGVLEQTYKGGGSSSYHPRMLLSGQSKPDHNTINDFRDKRLQWHLKKIFHQYLLNKE